MAEPGAEQLFSQESSPEELAVDAARNAQRAESAARKMDERQSAQRKVAQEKAESEKREKLLKASRVSPSLATRLSNDALERLNNAGQVFEGETPQGILKDAFAYFQGGTSENNAFNSKKFPGDDREREKAAYSSLRSLAEFMLKNPPKDFNDAQKIELRKFVESKPGDLSSEELRRNVQDVFAKTPFGANFYEYANNERLSESYPDSVEQLVQWVVDFEGEKYRTGGEYELMNEKGEVQLHNFLRWFRGRMIYYHTLSPDNPEVSFFSNITILLPLNRLSLGDLIGNDRFWRKQVKTGDLEIVKTMNPYTQRIEERVESRTQILDHEPYQHFREYLLMEAYLFESSRNLDAKYRQIMGTEGELFKMLQGSFTFNVFTQDENRMAFTWRIPGNTEKDMELISREDYPEKEGAAGKGVRVSDVLYYNMGELEYFPDNPHDNAFFEALGPGGTKTFYQSLIKRHVQGNLATDKFRSFNELSSLYQSGDKIGTFLKFAGILNGSTAKDKEGKEVQRAGYLDILLTNDSSRRAALLGQYGKEIAEAVSADLMKEQIRNFQEDPSLKAKFDTEFKKRLADTIRMLSSVDSKDLKLGLKAKGWSDKQVHEVDNYNSSPENLALLMIYHFNTSVDNQNKFQKDGVVDYKKVRSYMNIFNAHNKPKPLISAMRGAIRDSIGKLYGLDSMEAQFAESLAYSKARWTGSAARNDTTAKGFDAWTKLLRFKEYRLGQDGKNDVGSLYNINGIQRLNVTYWEGLNGTNTDGKGNSRKITLLEAMQGSEGDVSNAALNAPLKNINIEYNLERTYGENHLGRGFELYQYILYQVDAKFDELIKYDKFGNASVDHKKMADLWNKTYKSIRYTYTQMGFPHENLIRDVYKEYYRDPGRTLTFEHGRPELRPKLKTRLVYRSRKLKESMFDDEVLNLGLYDRPQFDDKWTGGKVGKGELNEFARNILGYLIAKEVEANRDPHNPDKPRQWTINEVELIRQYFNNYPLEIDPTATSRGTNPLFGQKGRYKRVRVQSGFFNNDEMAKISGVAKSRKRILWWGIFWNLFFATFFIGVTSSFKQAGKVKLS